MPKTPQKNQSSSSSRKKKTPGRNIALTPELIEQIANACMTYGSYEMAYKSVGLASSTFYRYLSYADDPKKDEIYRDFRDALYEAKRSHNLAISENWKQLAMKAFNDALKPSKRKTSVTTKFTRTTTSNLPDNQQNATVTEERTVITERTVAPQPWAVKLVVQGMDSEIPAVETHEEADLVAAINTLRRFEILPADSANRIYNFMSSTLVPGYKQLLSDLLIKELKDSSSEPEDNSEEDDDLGDLFENRVFDS